jgi:hypothetical protein
MLRCITSPRLARGRVGRYTPATVTQGYQIIATGADRYLHMASACAASLRLFDGTRPVQLVTDRSEGDIAHRSLFDVVTPCIAGAADIGPMIKLHAHTHAVFDETMFVDADCLLLKRDIDRYWERLTAGYNFALPGLWRDSGEWYGMDIAAMCALAGIPRLVQMNSGTFYFKRSSNGAAVFEAAWELFDRLGNFTGHIHRGTGAPDEPFLALAMGKLRMDPFPMRDDAGNSWMTATMNSLEVQVDAHSGAPALVKRHRTLSPSLCHFTNLFPRETYLPLMDELLAMASPV